MNIKIKPLNGFSLRFFEKKQWDIRFYSAWAAYQIRLPIRFWKTPSKWFT